MTKRLYYQDPYQRIFDAIIVERRTVNGQFAVVLDQTAFYPTGGGQPNDTGTLNGSSIVDVQIADDGAVIHLLEKELAGSSVRGEVNWARRFDHMQQHTGQHILSQAFAQTLDADTVGFHLGEDGCTIDLNRAPLSAEQVAQSLQSANQIVFENRPVLARFVDRAELSGMPLRKMPTVEEAIRIVQVQDFDWSPCGGTHVARSGEVGAIQVVRVERRKDVTRIHFLCGWRALADYTRKQGIVQQLSSYFTTAEDEIVSSVQHIDVESKATQKKLVVLQKQLVEYQLQSWISQAEQIGQAQVVSLTFEDQDLDMVKEVAHRLTARPGVVALLAAGQPRMQLVFARAEDIAADMGDLMRAACTAVGGRGGGRPPFAQGSIPDYTLIDQALFAARARLRE